MKEKTGYVDTNDIRMFYREIGDGPPLLLFHGGLLTGKYNWGKHYGWLSEHFRVISPDHRGHGCTNNPSGRFESYGQLASDMNSFIDQLELPERPVVMGLSSGGAIALHLSALFPEQVKRQLLIGIHSNIGRSERFKQGLREVYSTDDHRKPPSKWRHILTQPSASLLYWWIHREVPWHELLTSAWVMWIREFDLTDEDYARISAPTLIVAGDDDEFGFVDDFKDLDRRIGHSDLDILVGKDHLFVINDDVDDTRKLISPFLLGE